MSTVIRYNDFAELVLADASNYHESEFEDLWRVYPTEVEHALDYSQDYPEAVPIILEVVRQKVIHRFPYSIMYVSDEEGIFILAIANKHRRPFHWSTRL